MRLCWRVCDGLEMKRTKEERGRPGGVCGETVLKVGVHLGAGVACGLVMGLLMVLGMGVSLSKPPVRGQHLSQPCVEHGRTENKDGEHTSLS